MNCLTISLQQSFVNYLIELEYISENKTKIKDSKI